MASERVGGAFHHPGSSASHSAELRLKDDGAVTVVSIAGAVLAASTLDRLRISPRVGNIPRRVEFPDGSLFETSDNDAIDRFSRTGAARRAGFIHALERFHPRLLAFAALAILLAVGIYRYAVPILVEVAVAVTPPVVPELMSKGTMQALDQTLFSPSTLPEARQREISEAFKSLAAHSSRGAAAYTLHFRNGGFVGPNAFALPDGSLFITDELVGLARNDDMILGVLAHEIGHVEAEHSLRQLYRAAGVAGLIMLIGGDIGQGMEDILVQGAGILALSHSRDAEREADRISVELMLAAGRDPLAVADLFGLLAETIGVEDGENDSSFLSTHPGMTERRKEIADHVKRLRDVR